MTTVKTGHQPLHSSLPPAEVTLLEEVRIVMIAAHKRSRWPGSSHITRAGLIRAALRFMLEHRDDFYEWLHSEASLGRRDAE